MNRTMAQHTGRAGLTGSALVRLLAGMGEAPGGAGGPRAAFADGLVQWVGWTDAIALSAALERAGFTIDESAAGLYLWCTRGESALESVAYLAERGILVAPGTFYGPAGARHIRAALTASDEHIAAVAARLTH